MSKKTERAKHAIAAKERYDRYKAAGLCAKCGAARMAPFLMCKKCHAINKSSRKRFHASGHYKIYRIKNKKKVARYRKRYFEKHKKELRIRSMAKYHAFIKTRKCVACGKRHNSGLVKCQPCNKKQKAAQDKWREKNRLLKIKEVADKAEILRTANEKIRIGLLKGL